METLNVVVHHSLSADRADELRGIIDKLGAAHAYAVALLANGEDAVVTEEEGTEPMSDLLQSALYDLDEAIDVFMR